jgi:hypothetical protein
VLGLRPLPDPDVGVRSRGNGGAGRFWVTRPYDTKIKETIVRGAVMYAPGDVRVEERPDPQILKRPSPLAASAFD